MKKVLFFFILSSSFFVTSCLKSTRNAVSPVAPGYMIYSVVDFQNTISLDAARVAFRLNLLLSEAKKQEITDLDEVKVKINEKEEVALKRYLFNDTKIELISGSEGQYQLQFKSDSYAAGKSDYVRSGMIAINTYGKLLGELTEGQSWHIVEGPVKERGFSYGLYINKVKVAIKLPISSTESYSVSATSEKNEWIISIKESTVFYPEQEDYKSTWNIRFNVKQSGDGGQNYADLMASEYYMYGKADGETMPVNQRLMGAKFSYETTNDLMYKPSCSVLNIHSGSERILVTGDQVDTEYFESNIVSMKWINPKNDCNSYYILTYNGWAYDSYERREYEIYN